MKYLWGLLLFPVCLATEASSEELRIPFEDIVPFNCSPKNELLAWAAEKQCAVFGLSSKSVEVLECRMDHDDGGYVDYFAVKANAVCGKK